VSGGSSGIGLALARRLRAAGWHLSLIARDRQRLIDAQGGLLALQPASAAQIGIHSADVADAEAVDGAVAAALASFGPPALLIASAGMVAAGRIDDLPPAAYRRSMDVNYFGTLHLVRAALPAMRRAGNGRIVLIASGAGLLGLYGYTAYAPTKFAVRGLGEALRSELAPDGIRVSVVYPPDTDTPQLREELRTRPEATSRVAGNARVRSADEVAAAALRGIARNRFVIAAGWEMSVLALLHSLIGAALHRFWFDPVIARSHRRDPHPLS